jgi:hypothetical protein
MKWWREKRKNTTAEWMLRRQGKKRTVTYFNRYTFLFYESYTDRQDIATEFARRRSIKSYGKLSLLSRSKVSRRGWGREKKKKTVKFILHHWTEGPCFSMSGQLKLTAGSETTPGSTNQNVRGSDNSDGLLSSTPLLLILCVPAGLTVVHILIGPPNCYTQMITNLIKLLLQYMEHNTGTYICRLRNNLLIHTTCFDPNGSSSGAFRYTLLVIGVQLNILIFTFTRCKRRNRETDYDLYDNDNDDNDKPIKSLLKGKGLLPLVGLARLDS